MSLYGHHRYTDDFVSHQANVRARRGADVSGRLDLPLLARPAAGSLWPCYTPERAYHHRHDTPKPSGLVASCVTGLYPTYCPWCLISTNPLARWTPQGFWPNARMLMWPPSRKRLLMDGCGVSSQILGGRACQPGYALTVCDAWGACPPGYGRFFCCLLGRFLVKPCVR